MEAQGVVEVEAWEVVEVKAGEVVEVEAGEGMAVEAQEVVEVEAGEGMAVEAGEGNKKPGDSASPWRLGESPGWGFRLARPEWRRIAPFQADPPNGRGGDGFGLDSLARRRR